MYTGFQRLLIDLATTFGLDKELNHVRLAWAEDKLNLFKVDTLLEMNQSLKHLQEEADDKPHFYGVCLAIWDTYKGKPTNWMIAQDSSSSGCQLMSTMLRCETGMGNTGVLGKELPDLYTHVHGLMGIDSIDRKTLKKGMIPHFYASTAAPKQVFGDDYKTFLQAYMDTVPRAQMLSNALVGCWDENATEHVLVAPDGFTARIPVLVSKKKSIPCGKHTFDYHYQEVGTKSKKAIGSKSLSAKHYWLVA